MERQYNSMRSACEALRLVGEDGLSVIPTDEAAAFKGMGGTVDMNTAAHAARPAGARDPAGIKVKVVGKHYRGTGKDAHEGQVKTESKGEVVEVDVAAAAQRQKDVGRLYRIAMEKKGVFDGVPIEYARCQTDTPPKQGWDHSWTRRT